MFWSYRRSEELRDELGGGRRPTPVCSRRRPRVRSAGAAETWYVRRTNPMQILDSDLLAYLEHRAGVQAITRRKKRLVGKALELNSPAVDYAQTFGDSEVPAYVGFLDLAGFSVAVHGRKPAEIAAFLQPFLGQVIEVLGDHGILVDKTIGDEVMFVLPDGEEEHDHLELLTLGQAMGALHDLAFKLGEPYRYRIGLAYGDVSFFRVGGARYAEWTCVGETVHIAKRLHELPQLARPAPVCGAFGMAVKQGTDVRTIMKHCLGRFAGVASRFTHEFLPAPHSFKGVGDVVCALLLPQPDRVNNAVDEA